MNAESLREYCLAFPGTTETVQWGADLVFKVGGKMFTVLNVTPGETGISFKCTPDEFAELVEREDIAPAAYAARYHWVTVQAWSALSDRETRRLIRDAYEMVRGKLSRRVRDGLTSPAKTTSPGAPRRQSAAAWRTAAR